MNQEIFAARRKAFLEKMRPGSMAILFAAPHAKRNDDVHYEFRTNSYFYYLTGVREQEAAAIFLAGTDKPYRLFVMPKTPEMEMWEGKRYGVDESKRVFRQTSATPSTISRRSSARSLSRPIPSTTFSAPTPSTTSSSFACSRTTVRTPAVARKSSSVSRRLRSS